MTRVLAILMALTTPALAEWQNYSLLGLSASQEGVSPYLDIGYIHDEGLLLGAEWSNKHHRAYFGYEHNFNDTFGYNIKKRSDGSVGHTFVINLD